MNRRPIPTPVASGVRLTAGTDPGAASFRPDWSPRPLALLFSERVREHAEHAALVRVFSEDELVAWWPGSDGTVLGNIAAVDDVALRLFRVATAGGPGGVFRAARIALSRMLPGGAL